MPTTIDLPVLAIWLGIITALVTSVSGWFTAWSVMRKNKAEAEEKVANVKKIKVDAAAVAVEAATDVMQGQAARIEALHNAITRADERYCLLERRFEETQVRLDETRESLRCTKVILKESEVNQASYLARIVQLEADILKVQSSAIAKERENETRVATLATENESLRAELASLRDSYALEREEWLAERALLEAKVTALEKIVGELRASAVIGG